MATVTLDLRRPHQVYRNKAGTEVPGVTTVLRVYDKPALLSWYGREERAGILRTMRNHIHGADGIWTAAQVEAALPKTKDGEPKLFAVTKRDAAGDVGTIAHAMIEASLQGNALSPDGLDPKLFKQAQAPARRYLDWAEVGDKRHVVWSEIQMVSEKYQCGGTADVVLVDTDDKKLELHDIKTGGSWYDGYPYDEQFAQVAAYAEFYEELHGERIERIYIARVGKTADDPGDIYLMDDEQRAIGLRMFARAVEHYEDRFRMKSHNTERASMAGFQQ